MRLIWDYGIFLPTSCIHEFIFGDSSVNIWWELTCELISDRFIETISISLSTCMLPGLWFIFKLFSSPSRALSIIHTDCLFIYWRNMTFNSIWSSHLSLISFHLPSLGNFWIGTTTSYLSLALACVAPSIPRSVPSSIPGSFIGHREILDRELLLILLLLLSNLRLQ